MAPFGGFQDQTDEEVRKMLMQAAGVQSPFAGAGMPSSGLGVPPPFSGGSSAFSMGSNSGFEPQLQAAQKATPGAGSLASQLPPLTQPQGPGPGAALPPTMDPFTFPGNIGAPTKMEAEAGIGAGWGGGKLGGQTLPRPFTDPLAAYEGGYLVPGGLTPSEQGLYNQYVTQFGPKEGFAQNPYTGPLLYGQPTTINAGIARSGLGGKLIPEGTYQITPGLSGPGIFPDLQSRYSFPDKPKSGFLGDLGMGFGGLGGIGGLLSLLGFPEIGVPLGIAGGLGSGSIAAAQGNPLGALTGFGGALLGGLGGLGGFGGAAEAATPAADLSGGLAAASLPESSLASSLASGAIPESNLAGALASGAIPESNLAASLAFGAIPESNLAGSLAAGGGSLIPSNTPTGGFGSLMNRLGLDSPLGIANKAVGLAGNLLPGGQQQPGGAPSPTGGFPAAAQAFGTTGGGTQSGGMTGASRAAGAGSPLDPTQQLAGQGVPLTPEALEQKMRAGALGRFQGGLPMAPGQGYGVMM